MVCMLCCIYATCVVYVYATHMWLVQARFFANPPLHIALVGCVGAMGLRQTELPYICNLQAIKKATQRLERLGDPGKITFTFVQRKASYTSAVWSINAQRSLFEFFARKRRERLMTQMSITDFFSVVRLNESTPFKVAKKQLTLRAARAIARAKKQ